MLGCNNMQTLQIKCCESIYRCLAARLILLPSPSQHAAIPLGMTFASVFKQIFVGSALGQLTVKVVQAPAAGGRVVQKQGAGSEAAEVVVGVARLGVPYCRRGVGSEIAGEYDEQLPALSQRRALRRQPLDAET